MQQSELYTYARRLVNANTTDYPEADLVIDLNDAQSDIWTRIKEARGVLEYDDTNYTDLPSATFSISASTNKYKITADENSNEVITIHKVVITDSDGEDHDIPRLKVGEGNQDALINVESDFPTGYYEVGATVVFNSTPDGSYTATCWFDRAPSYLATGGTTVEPGIPVIYHKLLAEKAALTYAVSKGLNQVGNISRLVEMGEERLDRYESNRRNDEQGRIIPASIDAR